ncbi:MAG: methyltransferase [Propionibacteriaceae bacterium]|jgi:methylase of polypeptide subunit release factors|nr:methyltransferase [Propionibacteriaceae bacterium]
MDSYAEAMKRLRDDFMSANYFADPVMDAIGRKGQLALTRNHTIAAERALSGRDDRLATLIRLFVLQQAQPRTLVEAAVDCGRLTRLGLLVDGGDRMWASVDIRPTDDMTDSVSGWVVSDHVANLNTRVARPAPDHVLGASPASISLSHITSRRSVGRALDLGTGSGYQSLHLSRHAREVVATDVNPRALTLATLSFALNDLSVSTRLGSLYEPVSGEQFDLITTNPPFVIAPPSGERLVYREAGHTSDDLMRAVVSGAADRLRPGGSLHVVGNWAHLADTPWQDHVSAWIPSGCDAFIVEREELDPYEYIEVWLADAGLNGSADYRRRYDQWLAYFDACRVEAVGMGWITMVKSGSPRPRVSCLRWPHAVDQPVGADLMAHLSAMDLAELDDAQILDRAWTLAPGTVQETTGEPGASQPTHVVLRRSDGLGRAIEVDAALGGVLGACDGDLTLRMIISAVAQIMRAPLTEFEQSTVRRVRQLIAQTWLTPRGLDS